MNLPIEKTQNIAINMRKSAHKIFDLLENLLEWSRMQRGLISFIPKLYFLSKELTEIMELVQETAEKKMISITYDIPGDLRVMVDKQMFESVIRNLVFNAIKFTHRGGKIHIAAKLNNSNLVELAISDTGIGISAGAIDNLFKMGNQINRQGTEGESSTGLGLLLCKDFVEKNNGKIWAESEAGKGSVFYITLPQYTEAENKTVLMGLTENISKMNIKMLNKIPMMHTKHYYQGCGAPIIFRDTSTLLEYPNLL